MSAGITLFDNGCELPQKPAKKPVKKAVKPDDSDYVKQGIMAIYCYWFLSRSNGKIPPKIEGFDLGALDKVKSYISSVLKHLVNDASIGFKMEGAGWRNVFSQKYAAGFKTDLWLNFVNSSPSIKFHTKPIIQIDESITAESYRASIKEALLDEAILGTWAHCFTLYEKWGEYRGKTSLYSICHNLPEILIILDNAKNGERERKRISAATIKQLASEERERERQAANLEFSNKLVSRQN